MKTALMLVLTLALAAPAMAQDPDEFTPLGYEFCGWRIFSGGWTMEEPEPGAYSRLFARNMSCRAARRNYTRLRNEQVPPYRVYRLGYRCRELDSDHEYSDTRCTKRGRPRIAFRFQTGA